MRSLLMILMFGAVCSAGSIEFNLVPSTVPASPGGMAGVGYFLEDSRSFAVPTYSEFSPDPDSVLYLDGSLYTDFVSLPSNFVVAAPDAGGGQDFDAGLQTGLGEVFVFPDAPAGTDLHGTFTLHYDLYANDPDSDPGSFLLGDNTVTADLDIQVQEPSGVPEPSTFLYGFSAISFGLVLKRFRRGDR